MAGVDIVKTVNNAGAGGQAMAGRRLPSGDVILTMDTAASKEALQKTTTWLASLGTGAAVVRKQYTIVAQGVKISQIKTHDQTTAIRQVYAGNPGLDREVEILRVSWARKTIKQWEKAGKPASKTGPLLIGIAGPEQANHLIDAGLVFDYQVHECEPYSGDCSITQCYKCFKYGHIAAMCRNTPRCGKCSKPGHSERECTVREDPTKWSCINCPASNRRHSAWDPACPTKRNHQATAKQAYINRPRRFQERTPPTTVRRSSIVAPTPSPPVSATTTVVDPTAATNTVVSQPTTPRSQSPMEGIIDGPRGRKEAATSPAHTAPPAKRQRRPGRPPIREILQRSGSSQDQTRLPYNPTPPV